MYVYHLFAWFFYWFSKTEGVTTKSIVLGVSLVLHKLSVHPSSSLYWAERLHISVFAAVMLCAGGFEVCKWRRSDSPTYSGVPRISRTSDTMSTRRDKPKSTIRMSPSGWALVNRMFWGWRRHYECKREETLNCRRSEPVSPIKKKKKNTLKKNYRY